MRIVRAPRLDAPARHAGLGLGLGIFVSALTTKYRDLSFLLTFGIQLVMYATPVIYPMSTIPQEYRWLFLLNPLTPIMEVNSRNRYTPINMINVNETPMRHRLPVTRTP